MAIQLISDDGCLMLLNYDGYHYDRWQVMQGRQMSAVEQQIHGRQYGGLAVAPSCSQHPGINLHSLWKITIGIFFIRHQSTSWFKRCLASTPLKMGATHKHTHNGFLFNETITHRFLLDMAMVEFPGINFRGVRLCQTMTYSGRHPHGRFGSLKRNRTRQAICQTNRQNICQQKSQNRCQRKYRNHVTMYVKENVRVDLRTC